MILDSNNMKLYNFLLWITVTAMFVGLWSTLISAVVYVLGFGAFSWLSIKILISSFGMYIITLLVAIISIRNKHRKDYKLLKEIKDSRK